MHTIRRLSGVLSLLACAPALAHHETAPALPAAPDDLGFGTLLAIAAVTAALCLRRAVSNTEERR